MKEYRALVVEDDEDLGVIFSAALRSLKFTEVTLISDGARALAYLAEHEPELVLLDLHLPHLSGVNLLRQFTEFRLLNTRVVVVTADEGLAKELKGKADRILVKPTTLQAIRATAIELIPSVGLREDREQEIEAAAEKTDIAPKQEELNRPETQVEPAEHDRPTEPIPPADQDQPAAQNKPVDQASPAEQNPSS